MVSVYILVLMNIISPRWNDNGHDINICTSAVFAMTIHSAIRPDEASL